MMYADKIAVAVKVNGKVLREVGDTVSLPFGTEYSILIKNLNSVKAQVAVSIDGEDVAGKLVLPPNSSLELERYIRDGNLESGNRFKFIERTQAVEDHRGARVDDGLIRVEGWREKVQPYIPVPIPRYYDNWRPAPPRPWRRPWDYMRFSGSMQAKSARPRPDSFMVQSSTTSDTGITVPGSKSNQKFVNVSGFQLEPQSTIVVLKLRGEVVGVPFTKPVTVKTKVSCTTCGKVSKSGVQFCSTCGTALQLI